MFLQLEEYLMWLNSKGTRESNLKSNLERWKPYIVGGMIARHKVCTYGLEHLRYIDVFAGFYVAE